MPTINANKMQPKAGKTAFLMLIKALNDADQYSRRHDYAWRYSNGRTESTKEVTEAEAFAIITELVNRFGIVIDTDEANEKRRKLIALAHGMGWKVNGKADMERLNNWCMEKGPYRKQLSAHSSAELSKTISAFDSMYRKHMKKL